MRKWNLLFVVLLVCSCAKSRQERWPATVVGLVGFSAEEEKSVREAIALLNSESGQVVLQESETDGYPITIKKVAPPPSEPQRAGLAIQSHEECVIELSPVLFQARTQDYRNSVVLHEIGHCAGLDHTNVRGEVMYPTASSWKQYTEEKTKSFINSLLSAIAPNS